MSDHDNEREAFEAWYVSTHTPLTMPISEARRGDVYCSYVLNEVWAAWQARAAASEVKPPVDERNKAFDDGARFALAMRTEHSLKNSECKTCDGKGWYYPYPSTLSESWPDCDAHHQYGVASTGNTEERIKLPYDETFNAIAGAVAKTKTTLGISVKAFEDAFQPTLRKIARALAPHLSTDARVQGLVDAARAMVDAMSRDGYSNHKREQTKVLEKALAAFEKGE